MLWELRTKSKCDGFCWWMVSIRELSDTEENPQVRKRMIWGKAWQAFTKKHKVRHPILSIHLPIFCEERRNFCWVCNHLNFFSTVKKRRAWWLPLSQLVSFDFFLWPNPLWLCRVTFEYLSSSQDNVGHKPSFSSSRNNWCLMFNMLEMCPHRHL